MAFFVITATLTTAGKTLLDTAKANSQTVTVDKIVFGDYTGTVSASTTSIGNVIETADFITQSCNLALTRAEFQFCLRGQPADKVGTVGVYSGTTLVCVARFTVPNNTAGNTYATARVDTTSASVFAKPASTVAASILADTYKKAYDDSLTYIENGAVTGQKAFFGIGGGKKEADWFCGFVNLIADAAEMASTVALATEGTVAYYLQDSKKYVMTSGAWVVQFTGSLTDVVRPGRLYRSELTKSVYYARAAGDLLRVYTHVDWTADIVFTLTGTNTAKTIPMAVSNVTADYFFDNNPTPIRRTSSGAISVPLGATKLYVRFLRSTVVPNSVFGLTNNDCVESIFDWTTYPLSVLPLTGSTALVTVPGTFFPPSITDMSSMFSNCVNFAPQTMQWDTSRVTRMNSTFMNCSKLACAMPWNTGACTDFAYMFAGCTVMNNGLNAWNMSNAVNLTGMLMNCKAYNQPMDTWNVSNVSSFQNMFYGCAAFNRSLNTWNVRKGTVFMNMFQGCVAYNQPMNNWRPGADNASGAIMIDGMFEGAILFNQTIAAWPFAIIQNMKRVFYGAAAFNQNLSTWIMKSNIDRTDFDTGATAWIAGNKPQFTAAP